MIAATHNRQAGLMASRDGPAEHDETACWSDDTPEESQELRVGRGVICQDETPHEAAHPTVDRSTSYHVECTAQCDYMSTEKAELFKGLFREFWESIPDSPNYCPHWRSWEHLQAALNGKFAKVGHVTMEGLKKLVCEEIERNGCVTAMVKLENLLRVIKSFGPFAEIDGECHTLCKLKELLSKSSSRSQKNKTSGTSNVSWFAGNMSREEAESCLKDQEVGTFLIRLSQSIFGAFVLSVVAIKGDPPIHIDFQYEEDNSTDNCSKAAYIWFRNYRKKFLTVHKLVDEFKKEPFDDGFPELMLGERCPNLPFNTIVTGYKGRK